MNEYRVQLNLKNALEINDTILANLEDVDRYMLDTRDELKVRTNYIMNTFETLNSDLVYYLNDLNIIDYKLANMMTILDELRKCYRDYNDTIGTLLKEKANPKKLNKLLEKICY